MAVTATTLRLNSRGTAVRRMEAQLAKLGYLRNNKYARDSYFGTLTRDALKRLQARHKLAVTGTYNAATRALVAKLSAAKPAKPSGSTSAEPANNYKHVAFRGVVVNARTRAMILTAERYLKQMGVNWSFRLTQGSYSHSVSASGGTHDGGGALDISVRGASGAYVPYSRAAKAVKALRMAGFAAWSRGFSDGTSFSKHLHAIAIGDRQLSSSARSQVRDYFRGRNGLVNHALDRDRAIGRPWPKWANKYR